MVDFTLDQDFSVQMAQLEETDLVHSDTFNPLYKQLINNDNKLNQNKIETSEKGSFNGIATLDPTGNVPLTQLGNVPEGRTDLIEITNSYTVQNTDYTIVCNADTGDITVTLPEASSVTNKVYNIKKMDNSSNTIIIDGDGTQTIDGETMREINVQYESITVQSTGTEWVII